MRDKIREIEWRHATEVEDREASPEEDRVVRDYEERGDEPDKQVSHRAAEEVSSSESDEVDMEKMTTDDEEELWRRVERDGFPREYTEVGGRPDGFPREKDIDTTPGVWSTPPHTRRDMGGRIIPMGEAEFRRHLRDGSSPDTREEGSDDTEVMEAEPPGEPERDKRTSTVETPEDVDVPEEPEASGSEDSGSERGDELEFEPDEEAEEARSDPGDEERLKTRGGTHDQSLRWRCRHPSVRDCAIYSRGR